MCYFLIGSERFRVHEHTRERQRMEAEGLQQSEEMEPVRLSGMGEHGRFIPVFRLAPADRRHMGSAQLKIQFRMRL